MCREQRRRTTTEPVVGKRIWEKEGKGDATPPEIGLSLFEWSREPRRCPGFLLVRCHFLHSWTVSSLHPGCQTHARAIEKQEVARTAKTRSQPEASAKTPPPPNRPPTKIKRGISGLGNYCDNRKTAFGFSVRFAELCRVASVARVDLTRYTPRDEYFGRSLFE